MRTIYMDSDFKCHAESADGLSPVETDFFDGKCADFIEGYRFVPAGESWTRPDGAVFAGEMVTPWKDWRELDAAQRMYERRLLEQAQAENERLKAENADMRSALEILEVTPDAEME